jgi:dienelactone hydrolase
MERYDPFGPGRLAVGVRTVPVDDDERGRSFPCEVWYPAAAREAGNAEARDVPAQPGPHPLIVFSHFSGGGRRTATYLTQHLASHGYVVAAIDHSEVVAPALRPRPEEDPEARRRRIDAIIASRVPDVRLLLSTLTLTGPRAPTGLAGIGVDPARIGLAGHSFGGWTALAVPESDPRVRAVVALAPGGSSRPVPGVLPLTLAFGWERLVPVLILTGDCDVPVPLEGVREIFARAPEPKQLFVLRRADHEHFADDVEASHEALRAMTLPGEAAWMTAAMRPASDLCPGEHGHAFTRGLALAHLDAALRDDAGARGFLARGAEDELAARGIDAAEVRPGA